MKTLIRLLLLVVVIQGCVPRQKCPPGQHFECGKGCVADPPDIDIKITTAESESKEDKDLILTAKYQISDKVCIRKQYTGVVTEIKWGKVPAGHRGVVVYTVEYYVENDYNTGDYYDTQLERGECQ